MLYEEIFSKYVNPFYERVIKKRSSYNYLAELEKSQFEDIRINRNIQLEALRKLLIHAGNNCSYYSNVIDIKMVESLPINDLKEYIRTIPFLSKDVINKHREELVAKNFKDKVWAKTTGGSTGIPLHFYYTSISNDWRQACTWRGYGWAECYPGSKQAYIWGSHVGKVAWLVKKKEELHQRLLGQKYYNCFNFTNKVMGETLESINDYKPKVIVGYTNPLYNFALYIKNNKKKIVFRPVSIITAAEALHDFQRQLIEEVFGCKVFHTYGSREFMLIASECEEHNGLHVNIENLFLEIIKPDGSYAKSGEIGEIVITDLHNWGMPFIRYKIGDMGVLSDDTGRCRCGRGLPLLKRVVGRTLDVLKTQDGRFVPGEFFPHFFKDFKNIEQFQVIQNDLKQLDIKLVLRNKEDLSAGDMQRIKSEVQTIMGETVEVEYHFVDHIPLTETGKRRVTISSV